MLPTKAFQKTNLAKLLGLALQKSPNQEAEDILSQGAKLLQTFLVVWNTSALGNETTSPTKDLSLRIDLDRDFESSPIKDRLSSLLGSSDDALADIQRLEVQEKTSTLQKLGSLIQKSNIRERASSVASSVSQGFSALGRRLTPSEKTRERASSIASSVGSAVSSVSSAAKRRLSISDETKAKVSEKLQTLSEQFKNWTSKKPQFLMKLSKKFTGTSNENALVKKLQDLQAKLESKKGGTSEELAQLGRDINEFGPLVRSDEEVALFKTLLEA